LRIIIEEIKKNNTVTEYTISNPSELRKDFSFKLDPSIANDIIFKEDTFLELGGPSNSSGSLILPISDEKELNEIIDGKITVIGKDIQEVEAGSLDFAQVFIMGGDGIVEISVKDLDRNTRSINNLEGYMIRATPRKLWTRVSSDVAKKGFTLKNLGEAFNIVLREEISQLTSLEIIFITTSGEDIKKLQKLNTLIYNIYGTSKTLQYLEQYQELIKKRDDCGFDWDCSSCDYSVICDEIDDVIARMKEYRKKIEK